MFKYDLDPTKKYCLSRNPEINLDYLYTQYPIRAFVKVYADNSDILCPVGGHKPEGLWYAFGRGWLDWDGGGLKSSEDSRGTDETTQLHPLYELEVNTDKFIKLATRKEIIDFHNQHSVNGDDTTINWLEVSKLYDGIEITSFDRDTCDLYWYRTYDISSGCIWNLKAIKSVTRINNK